MTLAHLYVDFGKSPTQRSDASRTGDQTELETEKLVAFESGYKSGWDDALSAQSQSNTSVGDEFAQSLQEISFSYHEARATLRKELCAAFKPVIAHLLPKMLQETFGQHVLEQIETLAQNTLERPIQITTSPQRMIALQALCEETLKEPFVITPDENVDDDDVYLRLGAAEHEVAFGPWLEEIQNSLASFLENQSEESTNG